MNTSTRVNDFFARSVQQKPRYIYSSCSIRLTSLYFQIRSDTFCYVLFSYTRYKHSRILVFGKTVFANISVDIPSKRGTMHSFHTRVHSSPFLYDAFSSFLHFISFLCYQSNKYRTYKNVLAVASCVRMCVVRVFLFFLLSISLHFLIYITMNIRHQSVCSVLSYYN